jgi:hypothetical protein
LLAYNDTTVVSGTTYGYRMHAFNNSGNSANSATRAVTTPTYSIPTVSITAPASGATYTAPATVALVASATSGTGATITKVDFFNGSNLIQTVSTAPFNASWTSVPAGVYGAVTAKVTNSQGATAVSAPISVIVAPIITPSVVAPTGDVSGNGLIDLTDVLLVLRAALGLPDTTVPMSTIIAKGDVYPPGAPDGVITMADALTLLEKYVATH